MKFFPAAPDRDPAGLAVAFATEETAQLRHAPVELTHRQRLARAVLARQQEQTHPQRGHDLFGGAVRLRSPPPAANCPAPIRSAGLPSEHRSPAPKRPTSATAQDSAFSHTDSDAPVAEPTTHRSEPPATPCAPAVWAERGVPVRRFRPAEDPEDTATTAFFSRWERGFSAATG